VKLPAGKLIPLRAPILNGALSGTDLPTRLQLLAWGENATIKGPVIVNETTVTSLAAEQARRGFDRVALDYAHNSLPGHRNFKADPREVAAYGIPVVIAGEGLFLDQIEWTPSGEQYARNYKDLSPTPLLDDSGAVIFLHSVALCPQGAVEGLHFFDTTTQPNTTTTTTPTMNPDLLEILSTLFGTSADATEADIIAAGKAYIAKMAKAADEKKSEVDPTALTALSAQVQTLIDKQDAREREHIIALAVAEGKIIPASVKALAVEDLRKVVAELPAGQVPLDRKTPANVLQPLSAEDPEVQEVCRQLGISTEQYLGKKA